MSNAWEMTVDDVHNAVDSNKHNLSSDFMVKLGVLKAELRDAVEVYQDSHDTNYQDDLRCYREYIERNREVN